MWIFVALLALWPSPVAAHPVTLAYMDVRPATPYAPLQLTVAIHPHQALLLIGAPHGESEEEHGFGNQIPDLQHHADLISAYLLSHITLAANGAPCAWEPTAVEVPNTELGALADGVSLTAPLICQGNIDVIEIGSTLFTDTFKDQQTIVRLETPEGFADRLLLDHQTTTGTLALSTVAIADVLPPDASAQPPSLWLKIAGWTLLAAALITIAVVAYRTNSASPKE